MGGTRTRMMFLSWPEKWLFICNGHTVNLALRVSGRARTCKESCKISKSAASYASSLFLTPAQCSTSQLLLLSCFGLGLLGWLCFQTRLLHYLWLALHFAGHHHKGPFEGKRFRSFKRWFKSHTWPPHESGIPRSTSESFWWVLCADDLKNQQICMVVNDGPEKHPCLTITRSSIVTHFPIFDDYASIPQEQHNMISRSNKNPGQTIHPPVRQPRHPFAHLCIYIYKYHTCIVSRQAFINQFLINAFIIKHHVPEKPSLWSQQHIPCQHPANCLHSSKWPLHL